MSDEQITDARHISDTERIRQVDLQKEMQRSYLDYAMSVIVGRALPDVRDGLKPVHRRVLYAMYDGGYRPTSSFSKSSRVVGEVMGNYHPHGDAAIYDALARLVQPWSLRYPLVAGQEKGHRLPKDGGIQRYKGLGEMNDHELWETTMDPTTRILKQVTLDEAADADETFTILMGDDVDRRRTFIQRNATDVRFLDI